MSNLVLIFLKLDCDFEKLIKGFGKKDLEFHPED